MFRRALLILALGYSCAFTLQATADEASFDLSGPVTVTRVVDGDSLRSGPLKIRVHGIDAPERKQRCKTAADKDWDCGVAATEAMKDIIKGTPELHCSLVDVDRYGRLIMRCLAGDTDIGEALVEQGLAMAYRRYSQDYVTAEQNAKRAGRGIWQGRFDAPWDWRKKN